MYNGDFCFKKYVEGKFLNAPGRAGQHVWKPETPVISPENQQPELPADKKKLKSINLKQGFRPLSLTPFKGVDAAAFGIKVKKLPKIKI